MPKLLPINPSYTIADLETLKDLSDPLRMRIFDQIGLANQREELRTVKQLAEELNTSASKLYYHINLLEKHGVIKVAETQIVSGILEKHYQVAAHAITIGRELLGTGISLDEKAAAIMGLLDGALDATRADMLKFLQAAVADEDVAKKFSSRGGQITRENARITLAQAEEFSRRLLALVDEFQQMSAPENEDAVIYGYTVVFYPVLGE